MYTLTRNLGFRKALQQELAPLMVSLLAAEFFFRFHSFILECASFLGAWYVLSWLATKVKDRQPRSAEE